MSEEIDCPGHKNGPGYNTTKHYICGPVREKFAALRAEVERKQKRIDSAILAALRYESRHDRDPERGMLWGELKMALMVDAPTSPGLPEGEKDEACGCQLKPFYHKPTLDCIPRKPAAPAPKEEPTKCPRPDKPCGGHWESVTGENHGHDSQPGDRWVSAMDKPAAPKEK